MYKIQEQNVILHAKQSERAPRVTIGVPTFNRDTLGRTLASLTRQTFQDFVVIVSDNAGENESTIETVRTFERDLPQVYLVAQKRNIGALGNLAFLLGCATTEYFLWLADDDEITENFLEELVSILDTDDKVVCAMGRWRKMVSPDKGVEGRQVEVGSSNRIARIFKFIAFEADDTAFYGLHRVENLRRCHFEGYIYPNARVLTNCCYVFLFDLIWQGPIRLTNNAAWISHNYSTKAYDSAMARGFSDKLRTLLRRLNVHTLYWIKTARKNPLLLPVTVPATVIGLARDIVSALGRVTHRAIGTSS